MFLWNRSLLTLGLFGLWWLAGHYTEQRQVRWNVLIECLSLVPIYGFAHGRPFSGLCQNGKYGGFIKGRPFTHLGPLLGRRLHPKSML